MQLIANENISLDAVQAFRAGGHDVLWIRKEASGSNDIKIMKLAHKEGRILITFYKDFEELVLRKKQCQHSAYCRL